MKNASLSDATEAGMDSAEAARRRAVARLGIARVVARRCLLIFGPVVELDDLTQEAALALVRAAHRHKAGMRAEFSTYAHRACWRACLAIVRSALRRREAFPVEPGDGTGEAALAERCPFEGMMGIELWALGGRVLSNVERQVLHGRFRRGMTLKEIGRVRGVTAGRVREIEVKALGTLARAAGVYLGNQGGSKSKIQKPNKTRNP